jgi:hypothetical protein
VRSAAASSNWRTSAGLRRGKGPPRGVPAPFSDRTSSGYGPGSGYRLLDAEVPRERRC